jgi:hypothetical protein
MEEISPKKADYWDLTIGIGDFFRPIQVERFRYNGRVEGVHMDGALETLILAFTMGLRVPWPRSHPRRHHKLSLQRGWRWGRRWLWATPSPRLSYSSS